MTDTRTTEFVATHCGEIEFADGRRALIHLRCTGQSWRGANGIRYSTKTGYRKSSVGRWDTNALTHRLRIHEITRIAPRVVPSTARADKLTTLSQLHRNAA